MFLCPVNIGGAEFQSEGLMYLVGKFSRRHSALHVLMPFKHKSLVPNNNEHHCIHLHLYMHGIHGVVYIKGFHSEFYSILTFS